MPQNPAQAAAAWALPHLLASQRLQQSPTTNCQWRGSQRCRRSRGKRPGTGTSTRNCFSWHPAWHQLLLNKMHGIRAAALLSCLGRCAHQQFYRQRAPNDLAWWGAVRWGAVGQGPLLRDCHAAMLRLMEGLDEELMEPPTMEGYGSAVSLGPQEAYKSVSYPCFVHWASLKQFSCCPRCPPLAGTACQHGRTLSQPET